MNTMLADLARAQEAFYGSGTLLFLAVTALIGVAAVAGVLAMTLVVAPNVTQRCAEALRHHNFLSFLAGLPFVGLFTVFAVVGKRFPTIGGLGILAVGLFALVGLAAASEDIGRRLFWNSGREGNRAAHLLAGWPVLFLAMCVPFVGWFLVLPYFTLAGLGSLLVGAFRG